LYGLPDRDDRIPALRSLDRLVTRCDLGFHGGWAVTGRGSAGRLNVHVSDGRIVHVGTERYACGEVVDSSGLLVLPGMVDTHVHLMDPGSTEREDFPSGTAAAAVNGVTTILEHTHAHPVLNAADVEAKRQYLTGRSWIDFGLVAHAWPGMVNEVASLWEAGVAYFKLFTCETHGLPAHDTSSLYDYFEAFRDVGAVGLVHCEDDAITAVSAGRLHRERRSDGRAIVEWRSRVAEETAVASVATLARHSGARVGIAHCSSPEVVELVQREAAHGAPLVAEGCPQYFLLREDEISELGPLRKFTPPARARDDGDEQRMWGLLREGALAFISSDHAPSTLAQKCQGDIWDAPFGLPGLDTTMSLLLDAVARGVLTVSDLVRVYSTAPAHHYGLRGKGALAPGADADIALVDLGATRTLRDEDVLTKAGWTPYRGRTVRGAVVAAWLRGEKVAEHGAVVGDRRGEFLPGAGVRAARGG
jgi:dihydroorotase (multifunctional complex type)